MSPAKKSTAKSKAKSAAVKSRAVKTAPRVASGNGARAAAPATGSDSNDTVRMVRELAAIADRRGISELIIDTEEMTLTIRRGALTGEAPPAPTFVTAAPAQMAMAAGAPAAPAAEAAPAPAAPEEPDGHLVTSPFVGTFYRRPNPDADTYADVGDKVQKGQVLCIVEAMKLMNEIEADVSGTIVAVLVNDTEPVEYGQPLFRIDPA